MTRARRDLRWREQAARLIARVMADGWARPDVPGDIDFVLRGGRFDVALVREHAQRLLAEADDLDTQREVFADWTRARGMGPENRGRGAFVSRPVWCTIMTEDGPCLYDLPCPHHGTAYADTRIYDGDSNVVSGQRGDPCIGGWPGKLAREYAAMQRSRRRCSRKDCDSGVLVNQPCTKCNKQPITSRVVDSEFGRHHAIDFPGHTVLTGKPECPYCTGLSCPECERFAATRTPRTFANGGNLRRAAQRLLDTLDGRCPWAPDAKAQPSECQACVGMLPISEIQPGTVLAAADGGEIVVTPGARPRVVTAPGIQVIGHNGRPREAEIGEFVLYECPDCRGTGHNLRGVLPPLPEETTKRLTPRRRTATVDPRNVRVVIDGRDVPLTSGGFTVAEIDRE